MARFLRILQEQTQGFVGVGGMMDEISQIRAILEGLLDLLKSLSAQIKELEERVHNLEAE